MNPYRKTRGKLIQVLPSGATITLLDNQPWAALTTEKQNKIAMRPDIYNNDNLKVANL